MFSISFRYLNKSYQAKVQKLNVLPVEFVVSDITPYLSIIPLQLVFESRAEEDALIYRSFTDKQKDVITIIGEEIFKACSTRHLAVHK